jgi:hypothetical protein
MLLEVVAFALVLSAFELVVIGMISPRYRLRLLGSDSGKMIVHVGMFILNMVVHWGTIVGTMSATLSFITSITTIGIAAKLWGFLKDGRYYTVGLVKYSIADIK